MKKRRKKNQVAILTYFEFNVREIVEIGRVVDGLDLDRYGGRPFSDVFPVDAAEERYGGTQLVYPPATGAQPPVGLTTEPGNRVARLLTDGDFGRKAQRFSPVHHFPVRFLWVFTAERRIPWRQNMFSAFKDDGFCSKKI